MNPCSNDAGEPGRTVRDAQKADLARIRAIYARHVAEGTGSFEEEPPTRADMAERFATVQALGLPFLVVESAGGVLGFAYASQFRARSAFRHTIEDSIYVDADAVGRGLGAALLGTLIARCEQRTWRQMIAVIGDSANHASIALHRRFGFRDVGVLQDVGFKFGRRLDVVLMQRALGVQTSATPAPQDLRR